METQKLTQEPKNKAKKKKDDVYRNVCTFLSGKSFEEDLKTFLTEENQLPPFFPIFAESHLQNRATPIDDQGYDDHLLVHDWLADFECYMNPILSYDFLEIERLGGEGVRERQAVTDEPRVCRWAFMSITELP